MECKTVKSWERKLAKYRATCIKFARWEVDTLKFHVASGNAEAAAQCAVRVARWYFFARPGARDVLYHDYLVAQAKAVA